MKLEGKVCLITGGSSGIGAATSLALAHRGADIAICCRHAGEPPALAIRQKVEALGRQAHLIAADLADPAQAALCVQQTVERFGRLDVLVHCAGGAAPGSILQVDPEVWYRAFDIHVHAVFHLVRAAVPSMIQAGGGAILLVSSAAGARGCLGAIAYGVVKGALPQFTRALARELADFHIRVNCVSPGIIRTPFQDYLTPEQVRNNVENRIPLHREGQPEDVAEAISALVENDFVTGADLPIDGGMTMRIV
jgi:NAD(P)-dependent dehydrogenase (short-subunit alcohol dehydrogenase family)